jgi:hypothetical protein
MPAAGAAAAAVPEHAAGTLQIAFAGESLAAKDAALFGKGSSDPYLRILRPGLAAAPQREVWRSQTLKATLNPEWPAARIDLTTLCGGRLAEPLVLEVWDADAASADDIIGAVTASVRDLLSAGQSKAQLQLVETTAKGSKGAGRLRVVSASLALAPEAEVAAAAPAAAAAVSAYLGGAAPVAGLSKPTAAPEPAALPAPTPAVKPAPAAEKAAPAPSAAATTKPPAAVEMPAPTVAPAASSTDTASASDAVSTLSPPTARRTSLPTSTRRGSLLPETAAPAAPVSSTLHLGMRGHGLDAKDVHLFGKASSDPYVRLLRVLPSGVRAPAWRGTVVKQSLDPMWPVEEVELSKLGGDLNASLVLQVG